MDHNAIPEHKSTITFDTSKPVERAYFFERGDGTVIHVNEVTAWQLISKGQQTMSGTKFFKYLGQSDGILYKKAALEAQQIFKTQGLEKAQERLREGMLEEAEAAKLNKTPPRNFDEVDRSGNPIRIADIR